MKRKPPVCEKDGSATELLEPDRFLGVLDEPRSEPVDEEERFRDIARPGASEDEGEDVLCGVV